jgi:hypothetical protein
MLYGLKEGHKDNALTWSMTAKDKVMLIKWERGILRKVYGPITEQDVWRIRTNQEVKELYKTPSG